MALVTPSLSRHQWTTFCEDLAMRTSHEFTLRFTTFSAAFSSLPNIAINGLHEEGSSATLTSVGTSCSSSESLLETVFKQYMEWFIMQLRAELYCQLENLARHEDEKRIDDLPSPLPHHHQLQLQQRQCSLDSGDYCVMSNHNDDPGDCLRASSPPRRSYSARLPSTARPPLPPPDSPTSHVALTKPTPSQTLRRSPSWLQTGSSFIREKISTQRKLSSPSFSTSSSSKSSFSSSSSSSKLSISSSFSSSTSSSMSKPTKILVDAIKEGELSYR